MQNFGVEKIRRRETNALFDDLIKNRPVIFLKKFFGDAFQDEFKKCCRALPKKERSYYVVKYNGRSEALFGIHYGTHLKPLVNISSFARLTFTNPNPAKGWHYIKAILEDDKEGLITKCNKRNINKIEVAVNKWSEKAFKDLEHNGLPQNIRMELSPLGEMKLVRLLIL